MGVHSLWNILEPSSRPVRLESLSRRKMAVDASIWIYQFLKAVRNQQGHSLHASHIVGFFRRICKLLYFGIQPVFVFDGGAPHLKKEVIRLRKERRQGKRDNAEKTAAKLLALQLQKKNEEAHTQSKKKSNATSADPTDDPDSTELRYLEEFDGSIPKERVPARDDEKRPKGSDEYELPAIQGFTHDKTDTRLMSAEEYKDITEQLYDELDGIDLNTIDPASPEFAALPLTTQYMVLSQLRLRSRLRMGYSKEQLEDIFPESLNFSKFQVQMVQKRNYFTQRLMNISGMSGADNTSSSSNSNETRRIASERDRAYKIQKTEGGWALSLDDDTGMTASNPVDIDKEMKRENGEHVSEDGDDEDNFEWEDVDLTSKEKKRINQSISALPLPPAPEDIGESTIRSFSFSPSKSKSTSSKPSNLRTEEEEDIEEEQHKDSQLRQMEQMELLEAIQQSKQDLIKQQQLENQVMEEAMTKSKAKEPEINNDEVQFDDIPFAFATKKRSDLMNETGTSTESSLGPSAKSHEQRLRSEMDHMFMFDTSKSSILGSRSSKKTNTAEKPHVLSVEDKESEEEEEETEEKPEKVEKPNQEIPTWFQNQFITPFETRKKEEILKKKDETLGLVSWSEAQEIMEKEEKEKEEINKGRENENDVQIIEPVEKETIEIIHIDDEAEEVNDIPVDTPNVTEPAVLQYEPNDSSTTDTVQPLDYEFYESEEEQLNEQLEKEEEEHEQFQRELNPQMINHTFIATEKELKRQQQKELRDADEVTVTMVREVQELLARFGIPYITAPMEAEAQCAELLKLELVDGIITDDSDVFLFGGDKVYRNMFHEKHYVEFYSGKELEKQGLDNKRLIELAHLLGSDYTEGLKSVGPVNAMEILANFGGLEQFRNWFMEGQFDLEKQKKENTWERTLRKKLIKNDVILDKSFPDKRIDQAYLAAEVDHDRTQFVWGTPDLDRLRDFLMSSVGWTQERVDQVLVPLIRDLNKKKREGTQATLGEFYDVDTMVGVKRKKGNKRISEARAKMRKK